MSKEDKTIQNSLAFYMDLERILTYLSENNQYSAQISNTTIRYIGTKESTAEGKRQVFEIVRKVE